ncbi:hypothetical protein LVV83_15775 [Pseudomonas sp. LM20]|uniref:hypothetical protein n=1 Tax=Pseudomonas sp. LM20 TaxID=2899116 RepID=UPI001F1ADCD2|nr:hypothetical protein [Pseudomonas sp. LM20]MCE5988491.1 hypothetical protein [Pseudomonas sp. LM20]
MPTENRSSNTDPRDVFIRLNPLGLGEEELRKDSTGFEDQRTHSDYLLFLAGYRESHPEPQPAASIGPITESSGPADQHQGSKIADALEACEWTDTPIGNKAIILSAITALRADPGEVERLREGISKHWKVVCDKRAELENLRAQLAERDALLDRMAYYLSPALTSHQYSMSKETMHDAQSALHEWRQLRANAEPSAPIAWHVGGNGYDRICFEKPANLPGNPCIQAIHDQHQLIDLLQRYDLRNEDAPPDERAHGIPGTSFQRLNAMANQGE